MSHLVLYGFAPSTYTRTARMACEEKGVGYELQPAPIDDPDRYGALHPYRKMPVLQHGDVTVFETLAIATYVDLLFEGPQLQPAEPLARVRMLQWISACNDVVDADLVRAYVKAGDAAGDEEGKHARERLAVLDVALQERQWLAGEALSLADLFLAPMLAYALDSAGEALIEGLPGLQRWQSRMQARPSFRATAPHSSP